MYLVWKWYLNVFHLIKNVEAIYDYLKLMILYSVSNLKMTVDDEDVKGYLFRIPDYHLQK